jgi:hypothetical protein
MPATKKNGQNRKRKNNKLSSEASSPLNCKAVKEWLKVCEATKKRLEREA